MATILELLNSGSKYNLTKKLKESLSHETLLDLSNQNLTVPQLISLFKALEKNETITTLNLKLEHYLLDDIATTVFDALASMLVNNHTLTHLNLKDSVLLAKGGARLAATLKKNQGLKILNLQNTLLGDNGIIALSPFLESNQNLERLYLGSNSIEFKGIQALAAVLKNNSGLLHLDLTLNNIRDEEAQELAAVLEQNKTLMSLNLNSTFATKGIEDLLEALKKNQSLTCLDVGYGASGFLANLDTLKKLASTLETNKTLIKLPYHSYHGHEFQTINTHIQNYFARNKAEALKRAQSREIIDSTPLPKVLANIVSEYAGTPPNEEVPFPPPKPKILPKKKQPAQTQPSHISLGQHLYNLWIRFRGFIIRLFHFRKNKTSSSKRLSEETSIPPTPVTSTYDRLSQSKREKPQKKTTNPSTIDMTKVSRLIFKPDQLLENAQNKRMTPF